jgi:hypothetical protein
MCNIKLRECENDKKCKMSTCGFYGVEEKKSKLTLSV